ncbi:hypothetical protein Tco_0553017 [Tanacetum coccineum]
MGRARGRAYAIDGGICDVIDDLSDNVKPANVPKTEETTAEQHVVASENNNVTNLTLREHKKDQIKITGRTKLCRVFYEDESDQEEDIDEDESDQEEDLDDGKAIVDAEPAVVETHVNDFTHEESSSLPELAYDVNKVVCHLLSPTIESDQMTTHGVVDNMRMCVNEAATNQHVDIMQDD